MPRPPANPVNAKVLQGAVLATSASTIWLQDEDGAVARAWAPAEVGSLAPGAPIEVYVDAVQGVNGWWHEPSGLAVNQRGAAPTEDSSPTAAACSGTCGVVWQALDPAFLVTHGERCLTCAGPLAVQPAG